MLRTFGLDVLECPKCKGRMKLLALMIDDRSIARYLKKTGEPTEAPARAPPRRPPYWSSTVLRRKTLDDLDTMRAPPSIAESSPLEREAREGDVCLTADLGPIPQ